jgi:LacI family transcriptional regulator
MTLGALEAITQAGLVIPDDLAVVGFDDLPWAPLLRPSLTTVAQPTYDLGQETARLLLSRVEGYTGTAREVVLSPELKVRASSVPRGGTATTSGAGHSPRSRSQPSRH